MTGGGCSSRRGQSKVVGVLLMVGVALVLVAGLGVFVFDITESGSEDPAFISVDIGPTADSNGVIIEHTGGDSVNTDDMRITVEDAFAATEFDAAARMDVFGAGDRLVVDDRQLFGNTSITVIYEPRNSVVAEKELNLGELFQLSGNATFDLSGAGGEIPAEGVNVSIESEGTVLQSDETDENGEFAIAQTPASQANLTMNGELARQNISLDGQERVSVELIDDAVVDNESRLPGFLMNGDGNADPYEIETASDMQTMNASTAFRYELAADIDASHTATWNGGRGFVPIENNPRFDGRGRVVDGLTIDRPKEDDVGMFETTEAGGASPSADDIVNLTLENVDITGGNNTGAIAGTVTGTFGPGAGSGGITDSYVTGEVSGKQAVGGVAGYLRVNTIARTYADVDVNGANRTGGLVGQTAGGYTVIDSYAMGTVSGGVGVGGLVGGLEPGGPGGPLPTEAEIRTSFAAASVSGGNQTGGFIGVKALSGPLSGETELVDTYWDSIVAGQSEGVGNVNNGNATALSTADMKGSAASSNMNLDFGNTWETVSDEYPTLRTFGG